MSRPTLGIITIGQSPRVDMVPEMLDWLGIEASRVVERGALDGSSRTEIDELAPTATSRDVLTTRLADGSPVVLDHDRVVGRVQEAISWLEGTGGVEATLVVCTGAFPPMEHQRPVLFADRLLLAGVAGLVERNAVGVVCPLPEQEQMTLSKWRATAGEVTVAAATPYDSNALEAVPRAAAELAEDGAAWIVLDCMGYTDAMRQAAQRAVRAAGTCPVLLARGVVARLAGEVVA